MQKRFQNLAKARPSESGVWFFPGFNGEIDIIRCLLKEKMRNSGNDGFLVECRIVDGGTEKNPTGSSATWIQSYRNEETADAAVKQFLYAVFAVDHRTSAAAAKIDEECSGFIDDVVGEKNLFCGRRVHLETFEIIKRDGNPFTKHVWSPSFTHFIQESRTATVPDPLISPDGKFRYDGIKWVPR